MIGNKVRTLREVKGYTQANLAEESNLSIRTIQRIEAGKSIPKGHTLNSLAVALNVDKMDLQLVNLKNDEAQLNTEKEDVALKIKLINLSTLCFFIGVPLGNIFIPMFLWRKHKSNPVIDEAGRRIVNFQIIWSLSTFLLLISSPFVFSFLDLNFPIVIWLGILAIAINILVILKTAITLMKPDFDILPFKYRFL